MIGQDKLITLGNFPAEISENEGRSLTVGFLHAFIILSSEIVALSKTGFIFALVTVISHHSFVQIMSCLLIL